MSSNEIIGYVIVALATIVGLFITVGKPILRVNSILVELTVTIKALNTQIDELKTAHLDYKDKNTDSHRRIWKRLETHTRKINTILQHVKNVEMLEDLESDEEDDERA